MPALWGGKQSQGPATAWGHPLHPSYPEGQIQPHMVGWGSSPVQGCVPCGGGYLGAGVCYWGSKNTMEEEEGSVPGLCLALQPLHA